MAFFVLLATGWAWAGSTIYVAPTAMGSGNGSSQANAASYTSASFWSNVQTSLQSSATTVNFLAGSYSETLTLSGIGNATNHLTLQGINATDVIFNGSNANNIVLSSGSQNMTIKSLNFRGDATWQSLVIQGTTAASHDIVIDSCSWQDMSKLSMGAIGGTHDVYNVTIQNSTFLRSGKNSGSHYLYIAYGAHDFTVQNNTFMDCTGDYVRFRDRAEYSKIIGNNFISTNASSNFSMISIPAINDVNPGNELITQNLLISGNSFSYATTTSGTRTAVQVITSGYDPLGYHYLFTAEDGATLLSGTMNQKQAVLLNSAGLDLSNMKVSGNTYTNVQYAGSLVSKAAYGAVSRGWTGTASVSELFNSNPGANLAAHPLLTSEDFSTERDNALPAATAVESLLAERGAMVVNSLTNKAGTGNGCRIYDRTTADAAILEYNFVDSTSSQMDSAKISFKFALNDTFLNDSSQLNFAVGSYNDSFVAKLGTATARPFNIGIRNNGQVWLTGTTSVTGTYDRFGANTLTLFMNDDQNDIMTFIGTDNIAHQLEPNQVALFLDDSYIGFVNFTNTGIWNSSENNLGRLGFFTNITTQTDYIVDDLAVEMVPEPGTILILLSAACIRLIRRQRRSRHE